MNNSFESHQQFLRSEIDSGNKLLIDIDPDQTMDDWIVVVLERNSNVVYSTQCGCFACLVRYSEGVLIPLGGYKFDVDKEEKVKWEELTKCFHSTQKWDLKILENLIQDIPYWKFKSTTDCQRLNLQINYDRKEEIEEGWIPVLTLDGPGVLMWPNCD